MASRTRGSGRRTALRIGLGVAALLALGAVVAARAADALPLASALNESIFKLPVSVKLRNGQTAVGEMVVTAFKPAGPGPFPIAIINHGRNSDRSTPTRFRMIGMASYLVRQGFAVFVPTRLGYGGSVISGGEGPHLDPEDAGACLEKDYVGASLPAVQQIAATLRHAQQLSYTDPARHIVVGQSTGGFATVAYAAGQPAGLMAYVNFAGGAGGNPTTSPGEPCVPDRAARAFAGFGRSVRAPGLWVYTENDRYFAPRHSRAWFQQFSAGGAPTQFVLMPPFGDDGHKLMTDGLPVWRPVMDAFLARLGFHPTPLPAPVGSGYASVQDASRVPWLNAGARERGYDKFLAARPPKAFAISETGNWGWASGPEEPASAALANCNRNSPKPCVVYAVDDVVVWPPKTPVATSTPDADNNASN